MSLRHLIAFLLFVWAAVVAIGWMRFGDYPVLIALGLAALAVPLDKEVFRRGPRRP